MKKKETNKAAVRKVVNNCVRRDQANETIKISATNSVATVLKKAKNNMGGLSNAQVLENRSKFGINRVTHEKKKTLVQRLMSAFVNPFTAILFFLALVSMATDIIFPIVQGVHEDVDPLTVIIILTMVFISGTLRFVQESCSGTAAETLLSLTTTTRTLSRYS